MKKKFLRIIYLILLMSNIINVFAITNNDIVNNQQFIKIDDEVYIDKEITITLYLDNFSYNNFTFKLYSNNSLENINTSDIDIKNYNNEEIFFDYCINCSNLKTIVLNYKLPQDIQINDQITFNILIENKDNQEEVINYRKTVLVIDNIKTSEEDSNSDKNLYSKIISKSNYSTGSKTSNGSSSVSYKGSSNNYLSDIIITGYSLNKDFIKERLTYFITVPNNVTSLNVFAIKDDSKALVNISGNNNLIIGLNKILITVTSQDGRVRNYRIYVTRMDSDLNEG